jgi:hypothetical protein
MMIATTMNAAISEERDPVFLTGALQRWRRAEVMTISFDSDWSGLLKEVNHATEQLLRSPGCR